MKKILLSAVLLVGTVILAEVLADGVQVSQNEIGSPVAINGHAPQVAHATEAPQTAHQDQGFVVATFSVRGNV